MEMDSRPNAFKAPVLYESAATTFSKPQRLLTAHGKGGALKEDGNQ